MPSDVRLGHVAVTSAHPRELARFYTSLLGLEASMSGSIPALGDFVFLSRRAEDRLPLIALCTEPRARHTAVEVDTLGALKSVHAETKSKGITASFALNHGCSVSLYFHDPEGNLLEVLWPTGVKTPEPISEPLEPGDLERPEPELRELVRVRA